MMPAAWLYTHRETDWNDEGYVIGYRNVEKVTYEEPNERFREFAPYSNIRAVYAYPLEVTDLMVESALGDYSEGGLDTSERREVVRAIIQSALDAALNSEPPER